MKKLLTTISILLIATAAFAETYTVERVIDGNTIKLINGEEVRLIGIKVPEDEKMEQEATKHLKNYIVTEGGLEVFLENDEQKRDNYGRLLAYVYIRANWNPRIQSPFETQDIFEKEGLICWFVNAKMVRDGYAKPATIPPNMKNAGLFKELYKEAKEQKRGLWK